MSEYKSSKEELISDGGYLIPAKTELDISNPIRKLFVGLKLAKPIKVQVSTIELFKLLARNNKLKAKEIVEILSKHEGKNV